ncbi:hypothetical protein ACLKA7_009269 [Drosophila subpalustris]
MGVCPSNTAVNEEEEEQMEEMAKVEEVQEIKTVRPGTMLLEISKELEVEFQKIGIEIPANDIKTRMRSLVWRYYHARRCKPLWKYYKSMAINMKAVVRDEEKMLEKWKICVRTLLSGIPDAAVKKNLLRPQLLISSLKTSSAPLELKSSTMKNV